MARGLNKATLIGYTARDPEVRQTSTRTTVVNFQLGTTERYKDKNGKVQESTEWHNIAAFGKLAEIVRDYVKKGSLLYIEGKLKTRSWDDKETGQKRYRTSIEAHLINILSSNGKHVQQSGESDGADAEYVADASVDSEIPF